MKTCIDKVCEGVLCDDECKDLKPSICGKNRELFAPENACGSIRIEGADDVEINQGVCIDLTEGVHAYDGNGREIEYEVEPSEIGCCDVGEHEVTYTAIGSSKEMIPYIRTSKPMLGFNACGLVVKKVKRLVTILQALPPTIVGAVRTVIPIGASFDPMYGVSGIDDNGNATEVTFEGRYDVATDEADIVTFDSDVVQDLRSVKVSLEPIQNCTPWIGTEENNTPYLMRSVESIGMDVGNTQHDEIVGATVGWNQLFKFTYNQTLGGITFNSTDGASVAMSGTATQTVYKLLSLIPKSIVNHVYYIDADVPSSVSANDIVIYNDNGGIWAQSTPRIAKATLNNSFYIRIVRGVSINPQITITPQLVDLTAMFGTVIADYVYSLEQATAGSGIAWLKSYGFFTKDYYPYNVGELTSVKPSAHKVVGFNQWDEEWELGIYDLSSGQKVANASNIRNKNLIPILPNTEYCWNNTASTVVRIVFYDADKNRLSIISTSWTSPHVFTTPSDAHYMAWYYGATTYNGTFCINISDPNRNGEYEPYIEQSYPLDDSTEYRGLFKLDANNNLYADGDVYKSDGNVSRRYTEITLNGSEAWAKDNDITGSLYHRFYISKDDLVRTTNYVTNNVFINSKGLPIVKGYDVVFADVGAMIMSAYSITASVNAGRNWLYIMTLKTGNITTVNELKTWLASNPISVCYQLVTPTTETAQPYESSQAIYEGGTEEYIDTRDVPIPVGHETSYALVCPIYGYDSVEVTRVGKNLFGGTALRDGLLGIPNATDHASDGYVSYWANTQAEHNITDGMTFKENTQYTFIYKMYRGSATGSGLRLYYKDGTYVNMPSPSENYGTEQLIITSAEGKTVDRLAYYKDNGSVSVYYNESGIFEGDLELEDFEPYQADTYTSPLPQTVYGGTLDVVSGELVIDRAVRQLKDMPPNSWNKLSNTTVYYMFRPTALPNISYPFDSETAQKRGSSAYTYSSSGTQPNGTFRISDALYIVDSSFSTLDEWKAFASSSDIQFIYAIAEPITIQLTPQEVKSLVGENNVWSEDGKVQVVYSAPLEEGLSQFDYEGVYPITYHTEDSCGNETDVTRYVIVGDNIIPEDTYGIACQGKACYSIIECDENQ